jgi:hypothetical protein
MRKGRKVAIVRVLAYMWMGVGQVPKTTKKCTFFTLIIPWSNCANVHANSYSKGPLAWCAMCPDMLNIS